MKNPPEVPLNAGEMPVGARVADAENSQSDAASGLQPSEAALQAAYRAFDPDGAPFGSYAYHVAVVRAAYAVDFGGSRPALAGSPSPEKMAWCLDKIVEVMREKGLALDILASEIQDYLTMAGYDVPLRSYATLCAHRFDSTLCVELAGHKGPHVTSNEQFPAGRAALSEGERKP